MAVQAELGWTDGLQFIGRIRIDFVVSGRGVKPRDVERAISLSMTRYCSAVASLTAEVEHTYRIVEDERDTEL